MDYKPKKIIKMVEKWREVVYSGITIFWMGAIFYVYG